MCFHPHSPLLRCQEKFRSNIRDEIVERLEQLEQNLIKRISEKGKKEGKETKAQTVRRSPRHLGREAFADLKQFKDQLIRMKSDTNKITKRGDAGKPCLNI